LIDQINIQKLITFTTTMSRGKS